MPNEEHPIRAGAPSFAPRDEAPEDREDSLDEDDRDEPDLDGESVVELPLEDVLDLHSFAPKDVEEVVRGYLDDAFAAGFPGVRLIHGKGVGVRRELVRKLLAGDTRVASFGDAPIGGGSWGATIVTFRR
jgi:dsDNA-specific endonuclease/ATPase MutS2